MQLILELCEVRGSDPLDSQKSVYNFRVIPLYPQIQQTTYIAVALNYIFTGKNPCINGPMQFKNLHCSRVNYIYNNSGILSPMNPPLRYYAALFSIFYLYCHPQ